ncbi:hypothetical protein BOX15_Mlig006454g1 [Macrostomum lignano]|uniref:START domain-containing protein n=1 Tax=Macrostomum lignano TaxID=282301 RepID=A0A267G978_9PLAT|nr:hypothetical protein BOX15_Mlig006454g1 [Macrostomum lignano]
MQSSATAVTDFQLPASSAGLSVNAVTVDEVHAPSSNSATGMEATAASVDSGRHSKIGTLRRAFCLLVLFDLIFTCILWIFYTKYLGLDLGKAIRDQVLHYQFTSSVFDLVGVSLVRFILLEVFYAALRLQSPWVVAVTTAFSTAFIIVKIILYDYDHGHSVFDYLLPIMSLVLVWIETFLLDCKVLPKERADEQLNERSPLLSGGRSSSVTAEYVYRGGLRHSFVPSEGFVTPQSSPNNSDNEDDGAAANSQVAASSLLSIEERHRLALRASRLADESWQALEDAGWRCVHDRPPVRVLSQRSRHRPSGKAWRLETRLPISADRAFREIWDRVDRQADWNPTVQFSRLLLRLDSDTAIVHNATAEAGGGLIKARDFVTLCVRRSRENGIRYTGGVSIETGLMPKMDGYTRGENHPGCIACIPDGPGACQLVWIVDSDIKGWVPTRVIDQAMTSVMTQLGASLQSHASRIAQKEGLSPAM